MGLIGNRSTHIGKHSGIWVPHFENRRRPRDVRSAPSLEFYGGQQKSSMGQHDRREDPLLMEFMCLDLYK